MYDAFFAALSFVLACDECSAMEVMYYQHGQEAFLRESYDGILLFVNKAYGIRTLE